jgi:hypothetical protein
MSFTYVAPLFQMLGVLLMLMLGFFNFMGEELNDVFSFLFAYEILFFLITYLLNIVMNYLVLKYNHKNLKGTASGIFLFLFFIATWIPINFICLFKKDYTWEPIKHSKSISIDKMK